MPAQLYDIFFSGNTLEGTDLAEVKQKIAQIFNTSSDQLDYLFSGSAVKIKNGVDQDTAIKYRVAFRNAGALVEIRSADPITATADQPTSSDSSADSQAVDGKMTLLPPNTGSLIDCAPAIEPAPLPNIENITLANPGSVLDETAPPPALQIDTSELELTPANTGTLEDCQIKKEPVPLPDISQLKIVDNNN